MSNAAVIAKCPNKLRKKIKQQLNSIRKEYKSALNKQKGGLVTEWLCDNYYIFEREGRAILKELKTCEPVPMEDSIFPRIYYVSKALCVNGVLSGEEEIEEKLKASKPTLREIELLSVMLRAVLLEIIEKSCKGNEEEDKRLIGNAVKSLRNINDIDFDTLTDSISVVEQGLRQDPGGVYSQMSDKTRAYYRRQVAKLAGRKGIDEESFVREIIDTAKNSQTEAQRHVGYYLNLDSSNKKRGWAFLILEAVLPLIAAAVIGILYSKWYLPLLLYFPLWEVFRPIINVFSMKKVQPAFIPEIELKTNIPKGGSTLVVVSMILPNANKAGELKKRLLQLKRTNGNGEVKFCILADFKSAKSLVKPEDESDLKASKRVIDELNRKYGGGFLIAVRPRTFSKTQNEYTGWERKRGAITQIIRSIKGEKVQYSLFHGDMSGFNDIRYIMALDADTNLPMDTVSELVGVAIHPLNKPVIDESKGIVTSGYGILTPKIETEIESASKTAFSRIMAGVGGITAYNNASSDKYQDLFSESIFAGKGLIDVNAFYEILNTKFPPEKILSHDILEGGFLRVGYVSQVQVTDNFPSNQAAYLERLHRWVRGDWQNISFIFKKQEKNPLNMLSRYKLFDNLRRSFTPVISVIALLLSLLMPTSAADIIAIVAVLSVSMGELLAGIISILLGGPSMFSRLYYSRTMPVALAALTNAVIAAVMLVQQAYICTDAIIRALWRLFVSKKNLLQWVVSSDSERNRSKGAIIKSYIPSLIICAVLFAFGKPIHILSGLIFISNIPFAYYSGKKSEGTKRYFNFETKDKLVSYAAALWRYYDELFTARDNYLPPDNLQEAPVHRIAHRTSPTNIGLMLLCTLAARDFGFVDSETMCTRIEKSLDSIEKLQKWKGNLLNWYDTKTLKPLEPRYASTVDSGNFVCSLTALRQGLTEYIKDDNRIPSIIERLTRLIDDCNLEIFYNKRRKLFHIGFSITDDKFSDSYYDLLMSESRMTSYYAIANREIPKKHWGALGRTFAKEGRYTGPVSWTGTMFEYYMPHILLPAYENSLAYEALKFCSWCQKQRVHGKKIPWGISESGFYAFDAQLNYQYKAQGVQKLGLKRGLNSELVISPYSTFLLLPFEPRSCIKNLDSLEDMQMTGRCGFYEAIDFTRARVEGQDYAVVRSYMAHHIGMSMLSVSNALMDNIMQKRFMSDDRMAGAVSLLQEKIPSDAAVFNDVEMHEIPQRPERIGSDISEFDDISPLSPNMRLYTNGEWSSAISDNGASVSMYRGANITRHSPDLLRRPLGVFAFVKSDNFTLPITKALDYNSKAKFKATFTHNDMTLTSQYKDLDCSMTTLIHPRIPCEQRKIVIKNQSKTNFSGELIIYFEPSLVPYKDETEHPAFSKLFVEGEYDSSNELLVFSKRARNGEQPLCLAAGLIENVPFTYGMSREALLERPNGISSLLTSKLNLQEVGVPDTCAAFKIPVKIPPKGHASITLMMCAASTRVEAVDRALKVRLGGKLTNQNAASSPFTEGGLDGIIASIVLPQILYTMRETRESTDAAQKNNRGKNAVWEFGLSGDCPIIYININDEEDAGRALPYIRLNRKIKRSGILTDLVIAYKESDEYTSPILAELRSILKKEGEEISASIFTINLSSFEESSIIALMNAATYIAPPTCERLLLPPQKYVAQIPEKTNPKPLDDEKAYHVKGGYFTHGFFTVTQKPQLPWCIVLANLNFGTLISDKALGYTWAINSRENKLTPWYNDTMTDNRGEMLLLRINGHVYDLIEGASVRFAKKFAQYFGSIEGIDYEVTVWVPKQGMIKHCDVKFINNSQEVLQMETAYYTEPVLGVNRSTARFIKSTFDGNGLSMHSDWNASVLGHMRLGVLANNVDFYCCDRGKFLSGEWHDMRQMPLPDPCAAVGRKIILPPKRQEYVRFILSWGPDEKTSKSVCDKDLRVEAEENVLYVDTPDKALNFMINTWLPAQILNSRILGRTGFYQCGGAYGYRDQLQDVSSLVLINPSITKRQIIRCAANQFEQGDALHWWHRLPERGGGTKGVRTRYSDDLLWLPYVTAEYVIKTGDYDFLNTTVPYLCANELSEEEIERYFEPRHGETCGTIYEHCIRAVERAMKFGDHGLPLIGGGDWNDGFNNVGIKSKGESVWLAQFLIMVLERMAKISNIIGYVEKAQEYEKEISRIKTAIDEKAWDGKWYLRAFFDDGRPMGSNTSKECKIDSLSQSFATLCNMPDLNRRRQALDSAVEELVDIENGIIKLFTPAFSTEGRQAGYVNAYPEGIRENGGQYTHAAVWLCMALIKDGQTDRGYALLKMLNPIEKYKDEAMADRYKTEPYALAGDVYSKEGIKGRGGWSLYSGAAGWYYRTVYEELLGLKQVENKLYLEPRLPSNWSGYYAKLIINGATTEIEVKRGLERSLMVDGKNSDYILLDENDHTAVMFYTE